MNHMIDDALTESLRFLPATMLDSARLVCKRWKLLVESHPWLMGIIKGEGVYIFGGLPGRNLQSDFFIKNRIGGVRFPLVGNLSERGELGTNRTARGLPDFRKPFEGVDDVSAVARPRKWHYAAIVVNRKVYQFGGRDDNCRLKEAEVYDPATFSFTELPPMQEMRSAPAVYHHRGIIYVLGGYDGIKEKNSVEAYSIAENRWLAPEESIVPAMPLAVTENTAVGFGDFMYVVCGTQDRERDPEKCINLTQCFNFKKKVWTVLPAQKECRLMALATIRRTNIPEKPLMLLIWSGGNVEGNDCKTVEYLYLAPDGSPLVMEGWQQTRPANPAEFGANGSAFGNDKWLFYFTGLGRTSGRVIQVVPAAGDVPSFDQGIAVFANCVPGMDAGKGVLLE